MAASSSSAEHQQQSGTLPHPPDRIIFGSCYSQHYYDSTANNTTIWDSILSRNATAFVWGGDSIYADDFTTIQRGGKNVVVPKHGTPEVITELYRNLTNNDAGYKKVLDESQMTILGALDDHGTL